MIGVAFPRRLKCLTSNAVMLAAPVAYCAIRDLPLICRLCDLFVYRSIKSGPE